MEAREAHLGSMLVAFAKSREIFSLSSGRSKEEFFRRVLALSKGLRGLIRCGDRVAIAALTSECYLEWMLAVACAGGIVAPLNYRWSTGEAIAAVDIIQPAILVVDSQCKQWCQPLRESCPSMHTQVFIGKDYPQGYGLTPGEVIMHAVGENERNLEVCFAPDNIALICFTSGTTGTPKGVSLTHKALMIQSLAKLDLVGYSKMDIYVHTAPLCHIGGISSALAMVMAGSQQLFLPKFEAATLLQAIQNYKVSTMIVVPTMMKDILEVSRRTKDSEPVFSSVLTVLNGGGPLPSQLLPRIKRVFPNAKLFSAYGMTEACSSMTFLNLADHTLPGEGTCVGKPAPHVQITVRDARVFTRGPHVMHGYWEQAKETENVLHQDGWLDTGDLGRVDKVGNLWLLGRAKDVIKTGGENVYASEVEMVLVQHPSVSRAAVVGVPDTRLSEIVAAILVIKQDWTWTRSDGARHDHRSKMVSERDLRLHCSKLGLSRYKIPKVVVHQYSPLPETSTGKLKKDEIRLTLCSRL